MFVTYFLDGPVVSYDDLLRNDVELFVGYRRELMEEGIFERTEAAVTRFLDTRG